MSDNKKNLSSPFRIYMSHPIRGKKGNDATDAEIQFNINTATRVGSSLQRNCITFIGPGKIDIYIPGAHDEFVQIAWKLGYLNEDQILAVDCKIIDDCQLVVLQGEYLSSGMLVEQEHAIKYDIPTCRFLPSHTTIANTQPLLDRIKQIMKESHE